MQIAARHSHLNGYEWLCVHQPSAWSEIERAVEQVNAQSYRTKVSREKTMRGRRLLSPVKINKAFRARLAQAGWREQRTSYWVADDYALIRRTMHLPRERQKAEIERRNRDSADEGDARANVIGAGLL